MAKNTVSGGYSDQNLPGEPDPPELPFDEPAEDGAEPETVAVEGEVKVSRKAKPKE